MYIHEYGNRNNPTIIMLHPMEVSGEDLYKIMALYFKGEYHIISPDQGGHGKSMPFNTCLEEAVSLERWLIDNNCTDIKLLYGASMGVGTAYELLKRRKITIDKIWFDGGGIASNATLLPKLMAPMLIRKHRALEKKPDKAVPNLVRQYGEAFAAIMKRNFMKLTEQDIRNICGEYTHRKLADLSESVQKNIHLDYGSKDMNLKGAKKEIPRYFAKSSLTVRNGYGHCGYMAYETQRYVEELETYITTGNCY